MCQPEQVYEEKIYMHLQVHADKIQNLIKDLSSSAAPTSQRLSLLMVARLRICL